MHHALDILDAPDDDRL